MYVSSIIRELTAERQRQKLSLQAVADRAKCSKSMIWDWENGNKCPSFNHVLYWAEALGYSIGMSKAV